MHLHGNPGSNDYILTTETLTADIVTEVKKQQNSASDEKNLQKEKEKSKKKKKNLKNKKLK